MSRFGLLRPSHFFVVGVVAGVMSLASLGPAQADVVVRRGTKRLEPGAVARQPFRYGVRLGLGELSKQEGLKLYLGLHALRAARQGTQTSPQELVDVFWDKAHRGELGNEQLQHVFGTLTAIKRTGGAPRSRVLAAQSQATGKVEWTIPDAEFAGSVGHDHYLVRKTGTPEKPNGGRELWTTNGKFVRAVDASEHFTDAL